MEGGSGFLPPEPPGPEPDLGGPPRPAPPQPEPQQPPPPGQWQPQPWQPQGPQEPDNGPAVAGFVLSLVGGGLLVLSVGLLAIVSLVLAIVGLVYSRRGKRKIEVGETSRSKGLAQAGFVINIITLGIAAPLTILEIVFLIVYATNEEFREDFNDEFDEEFDEQLEDDSSFTILVRVGVPLLRGIARLVT